MAEQKKLAELQKREPTGAYPCDRCFDWHMPGQHSVTDPKEILANLKKIEWLKKNNPFL